MVKSNSSGIEVWSGSFIKPAQDQEVLDRGAVDSWNPPQRGLGVTGKSSTPRDIFLCQARLLLLLSFILVFTLLELDSCLVTLGCKPI